MRTYPNNFNLIVVINFTNDSNNFRSANIQADNEVSFSIFSQLFDRVFIPLVGNKKDGDDNKNTLLNIFLLYKIYVFLPVGITTFFFGEYKYGENLGVKIFDVPIVIGFNWVLLIILTGNFANRIFPKSIIGKVLFGSTMMILLDLLIEISAPKLDYWEFAINPVPFSNYFWWFVFSILFHLIYQSNNNREYVVSTNILVIHFLFFGLLALFL